MHRLKRLMALSLCTWACGAYAADATDPAAEITLSRYTTISAAPDPRDAEPLATIAQVTFPRTEVHNVSDAVSYLLVRTGYTLADASTRSTSVNALLMHALPESQRVLGPYRVDAMLKVLIGTACTLVINDLARSVNVIPTSPVDVTGNVDQLTNIESQ